MLMLAVNYSKREMRSQEGKTAYLKTTVRVYLVYLKLPYAAKAVYQKKEEMNQILILKKTVTNIAQMFPQKTFHSMSPP